MEYKFKQVWDGFVYHMTCRGSRRNTKHDKATDRYILTVK